MEFIESRRIVDLPNALRCLENVQAVMDVLARVIDLVREVSDRATSFYEMIQYRMVSLSEVNCHDNSVLEYPTCG